MDVDVQPRVRVEHHRRHRRRVDRALPLHQRLELLRAPGARLSLPPAHDLAELLSAGDQPPRRHQRVLQAEAVTQRDRHPDLRAGVSRHRISHRCFFVGAAGWPWMLPAGLPLGLGP
jgi:hypothetical protein